MSVYKRFVSYMFRYENGVKKDNVGYARIENYNEECRIHIHIKDAVKREQKAGVYLFYRDNDRIQGIFIKEMTILDGIGECKITMEGKNIGDSTCNFEDIGGIIVYMTANRFWGSEWDDKPIYGFEPKLSKTKETRQAEAKEEVFEEKERLEEVETLVEKLEEEEEIELQAAVLEQKEDCFSAYTKLYPFYEQDKECIGVSPMELCEISPVLEEWQKNDFVQYGYVRFRHIILLRKKGDSENCFIGVPGMYRPREEQMAVTYGFDKFVPVRKECAEYGDFGYWCAEVTL